MFSCHGKLHYLQFVNFVYGGLLYDDPLSKLPNINPNIFSDGNFATSNNTRVHPKITLRYKTF